MKFQYSSCYKGWCSIYQVNIRTIVKYIYTIVSFYCVEFIRVFIVLLCKGEGSLLCFLLRHSRLAIHLVYSAPAAKS